MRGLVWLLVLLGPLVARGELTVWGGLGGAWSHDSDVHLWTGPDSLNFEEVGWDKRPFSAPPFYTVRVSYTPGRVFGLMAEFTHDKFYADLEKRVMVRGYRSGGRVDQVERLGDTFEVLSISHGLNLVSIGGMTRFAPCGDPPCTGLEPYAFASAGILVPHVEVSLASGRVDEYQLGGFGLSGGGGLQLTPWRHLALFGEYRFQWARADVETALGGRLLAHFFTHQLVFGLNVRFGG